MPVPLFAAEALLRTFPATAVAFGVVFGIFVAALVVLAVITLRWAVRRDRAGRREWAARHGAAGAEPGSAPSGRGLRQRRHRGTGAGEG
jgi:hypothetical protein